MNVVPIEIRRCEYEEPRDDGDARCPRMGRVLRLRLPGGGITRTSRCREHSDWQEVRS